MPLLLVVLLILFPCQNSFAQDDGIWLKAQHVTVEIDWDLYKIFPLKDQNDRAVYFDFEKKRILYALKDEERLNLKVFYAKFLEKGIKPKAFHINVEGYVDQEINRYLLYDARHDLVFELNEGVGEDRIGQKINTVVKIKSNRILNMEPNVPVRGIVQY